MSETKTKNLCTVPAADLTDSQYFIAEDGGELKRIPKAQVVLKKLENMLATDTENLAGGGEVTAQELLDALAEQVANKLLAKSQVVNNLLATVEGNPLDATQGKALKELIDTTNNNLSKCNIGYSYNETDGTNAIYTAIPNGSTVWFSINGNTKVGQELGLSQRYEGTEIIIWKSSDWRGGALAIGGDGLPVMIGQNNGSNSIKWNPLALKDDLSNFVVVRQISADVTIPNGSPYSTSTHDITCGDIPSGYKYVGILRAWCIDPSCFVWNAYFQDEGKNAKIDVSNLNGTQKNTKLYISVLYAKIMI